MHELKIDRYASLVMKSFELDRRAPLQTSVGATEYLANKYRLSMKEAHERVRQITMAGQAEGIQDMNYAGTRKTNTFDAHRLGKFAVSKGNRQTQEMIYHAYFCEHRNIGEKEVLLDLAVQSGLDAEEAEYVLNTDAFRKEVRDDETEAEFKSIQVIPYFVIDGKRRFSGALSAEEMYRWLQG